MNTRSTAYYVIRSLVRFLFALVVMTGFVIGIPVAVGMIWPGLLLTVVLWAIVAWMYYSEGKKYHASAAE